MLIIRFSDYRDQGLTRPKVLIVLPFRESALRVVKIFSMLLTSEDQVRIFLIKSVDHIYLNA